MFLNKAIKRKLLILILGLITGLGMLSILNVKINPNSKFPFSSNKPITIGIVMPMDHQALRTMIEGFKQSIQADYSNPLEIKVQNAQGDMNVQRGIFQQMMRSKVDLIVPIGTTATQMAISMIKDQPIVSLAANVPQELQVKAQKKRLKIAGVLDEIGPERPLEFLKELYPNLKKITLIYSNSEKVFPEVEQAVRYGNKLNIKVQKLMIQALPELYMVSRLIEEEVEAIFILKDHLIVAGIQTLIKEAEKRNIPIMASDEGSVKEGASFAVGVREAEIGREGGRLAARLLQEKKLVILEDNRSKEGYFKENDLEIDISRNRGIQIQTLKNLSLFYNPDMCFKQKIDRSSLESIAKKFKYEFQSLEN